MHGWPVTEFHWRHLVPVLERAGHATIPLTLPGLGRLPHGALPPDFRKATLATWVTAELRVRGVGAFALIGHDWGAHVAALVAATSRHTVAALVIEEDRPGIPTALPHPGADWYPAWHAPFNRALTLAESMVPGREEAYYGTFLRQSAGPTGLEAAAVREYIDAYTAPGILHAALAYYRTADDDDADMAQLASDPLALPVLAVAGHFAMGTAVASSMRTIASDVAELIAESAGHYPAEQEPELVADAIVEFLARV